MDIAKALFLPEGQIKPWLKGKARSWPAKRAVHSSCVDKCIVMEIKHRRLKICSK